MNKRILLIMFAFVLVFLAACGNDNENETDELKALEVDFQLPEEADVDETIELKATVTYGDELVEDADEVTFEYWLQGNEEESTKVDATNNEDGTYTAEVAFDTDGVYELYAHTTARDLHTMPKKTITIGDGASTDHDHGEEHGEEGFGMHFMEPEDVTVNEETDLEVHLQMNDEPLEDARVRYEIKHNESDIHDWVETEEAIAGEYINSYSFTEEGTYTIVIHVENDEGLHEHTEQQIEVK